jgi:hypothetical protein
MSSHFFLEHTLFYDSARPIHFYGVDSLVALEFGSWFAREVGVDVPVFELLGNRSVEEMVGGAVEERWVGER